jgi:hypothetical protein
MHCRFVPTHEASYLGKNMLPENGKKGRWKTKTESMRDSCYITPHQDGAMEVMAALHPHRCHV